MAASVVPKLQLKSKGQVKHNDDNENDADNEKSKPYECDIWLAFIKNCFDMLYLHYDNPEERLQAAIRGQCNTNIVLFIPYSNWK